MGCGSSKVDDLPLVALCRERKELIRAAGDHRYELSAAHVDYFQSLKGIGEAFHRFVNEELSVVSSPTPSSPVLTLPPSSETKNKSKNSSSSTTTSLSHSLSNHSAPSESDSHLHFHSDIVSEENDHVEENTHMNYYYMRSSTAIPSMVYENPDPYASYYSMGGFYGGAPMEERPYFDMGQSPVAARQPSPPPPPPPEASGWDFLNPFDAFERVYSNYGYFDRRFGSRSSTSSPDSAQVRAREGIPDLEDEAAEKDPPLKEVKQVEKKGVVGGDFGEGTSKAAEAVMEGKEIETELPSETEKENKGSPPDGSGSKSTGDEENVRRKGVNFEVETSLGESTESSSRPSNITTVSTHQSRDLHEVVKEIKEQFKDASNYGKEVSGLLEAGKLRYRPRSPLLEALSCRIMDAITPVLTSSSSSSKQLNALKMAKARAGATERFAAMESSRLSSTLEKLYAWEKKLYKEVKDEERLRVIYEKKCKRLKILDDKGAELNKIDATQASIRKLLTKINVTIRTIDTISSRIHKLRDEELQPQLTELIQGFMRMWKNMVKCHQKQFQAIVEAKSNNIVGKTGIQRDSSTRAAKELEEELMKWYSCFNNWINMQKAYVEAQNGWLLKCLPQEREVTADGVAPFSPSRIGAPPVFIFCNDWYHAVERISEFEVLKAMHTFAARMHMLWELQDEERRRKLKAEYLSKDFERRMKTLYQEGGMHMNGNELDTKRVLVAHKDSIILPEDRRVALESMKKRLDEERVKHQETLKQVHEVASGSLEMGFIPIFEAMDNFTSEMLKAHEEVRIQTPGGT